MTASRCSRAPPATRSVERRAATATSSPTAATTASTFEMPDPIRTPSRPTTSASTASGRPTWATPPTAWPSGTGAQNNTIGGLTVGERNIISGNDNDGIWITDSGTTGNVVRGNWIGYGSDGSAIGNSYHGIGIENGAANNLVGGDTTAASNRIGNSLWDGVALGGGGTGNAVIGNEIEGNTGLGIDLRQRWRHDERCGRRRHRQQRPPQPPRNHRRHRNHRHGHRRLRPRRPRRRLPHRNLHQPLRRRPHRLRRGRNLPNRHHHHPHRLREPKPSNSPTPATPATSSPSRPPKTSAPATTAQRRSSPNRALRHRRSRS